MIQNYYTDINTFQMNKHSEFKVKWGKTPFTIATMKDEISNKKNFRNV